MNLLRGDVIIGYAVLVASSFAHNATYFELLGSTGAVATGVIQALRAVGVFLLSHFLFCERDEAQCFTMGKGVSTAVVGLGVIWFAVSRRKGKYRAVGKEDIQT